MAHVNRKNKGLTGRIGIDIFMVEVKASKTLSPRVVKPLSLL
jgi:hypothetical protein